ncbi:hypothetical protein N5853_10905 [Bartonella sp. HY329]|uniref:hypothetical protein n=1 Tax=unclassified Bartonella TaxID=2645622 RepID=UPI0021C79E7C|nr:MULTISPECIES: hypothetical protein [unclassified Bartonella]UXM94605.1 hypothetical protein N5853_10905 [Bartonella sp. HY329]UXN08928.1 hypothetical protein N5852_10915 [Bartonella sp. HY328]
MARNLSFILALIFIFLTGNTAFSGSLFYRYWDLYKFCTSLNTESQLIGLLGKPSKTETIKDSFYQVDPTTNKANKIKPTAQKITWYQPQILVLQPPKTKNSVSDHLWNGPKEKQYYCLLSLTVREDSFSIHSQQIRGLTGRLKKNADEHLNDYCPQFKALNEFMLNSKNGQQQMIGYDCKNSH